MTREEMTFGEADKIIREFGITCGASEVFENARVIAKHNAINRGLLEVLKSWTEYAVNKDIPFELISQTRAAIAKAEGI